MFELVQKWLLLQWNIVVVWTGAVNGLHVTAATLRCWESQAAGRLEDGASAEH